MISFLLHQARLFVVVVFPPSPRRLLRDLTAGSTMSDFGEEIPTSGEDYQLFPRRLFQGDNSELAAMSTASTSLPQGYRSLGQIISAVASMGISSPASRPAATTPGVSPQTPVTSVPVRPTVYVAASSPVVIASAARAVPTPEDVYLATDILENISPEEYRLSFQ